MSELTAGERAAFWKRLGVEPNKPFKEQRSVTFGGHPAGWKAEYRSAHRALPPGRNRRTRAELDAYFAELHARIDELAAGATT